LDHHQQHHHHILKLCREARQGLSTTMAGVEATQEFKEEMSPPAADVRGVSDPAIIHEEVTVDKYPPPARHSTTMTGLPLALPSPNDKPVVMALCQPACFGRSIIFLAIYFVILLLTGLLTWYGRPHSIGLVLLTLLPSVCLLAFLRYLFSKHVLASQMTMVFLETGFWMALISE